MKIYDCVQNGAGTCLNEVLIEDLLDACKAALAALTQEGHYHADRDAAVKWLRYAIAKAEGADNG